MGLQRSLAALVAAALAASLAAGCGSDDENSSSSSSSATETTAVAENASLPEMPPTSPPSELAVTEPLSKKPPTGLTVAVIAQPLPAIQVYLKGARKAADALGWEIKEYIYEGTNAAPQVANALNAKVDFILGFNLIEATLKPQLAAAKKAGVPIVNTGGTELSAPEADYYSLETSAQFQVEQLADWVINDSDGKANAVMFNVGAIPYLASAEKSWSEYLLETCPDCKTDTVDVSFEQLTTGKVPSAVVAYLQQHPDVDYTFIAFGGAAVGVAPALKAAGLAGKTKVIGLGAETATYKDLANGDFTAFTMIAQQSNGWVGFDVAARLSVGDDPIATVELPGVGGAETWVLDSPDTANEFASLEDGWNGPDGYEDEWKALWQVG